MVTVTAGGRLHSATACAVVSWVTLAWLSEVRGRRQNSFARFSLVARGCHSRPYRGSSTTTGAAQGVAVRRDRAPSRRRRPAERGLRRACFASAHLSRTRSRLAHRPRRSRGRIRMGEHDRRRVRCGRKLARALAQLRQMGGPARSCRTGLESKLCNLIRLLVRRSDACARRACLHSE